MKFKFDENLGSIGKAVMETDGHDVMTAVEQDLSGADDQRLYQVCRLEQSVLVTMDLDFAEVLRFPPEPTAGIAVLRTPGRQSPAKILARVTDLSAFLRIEPIEGRLWIIEPGRVRVHQQRDYWEKRGR